MAITRADARQPYKPWSSPQFLGLSTDQKPTDDVPVNSLFYELDTETVYYFNGTTWKEIGTA